MIVREDWPPGSKLIDYPSGTCGEVEVPDEPCDWLVKPLRFSKGHSAANMECEVLVPAELMGWRVLLPMDRFVSLLLYSHVNWIDDMKSLMLVGQIKKRGKNYRLVVSK